MTKELKGRPISGQYMGGSGKNLNERGHSNIHWGGRSGHGNNSGHQGVSSKTTITIARSKDYNSIYMSMCVNNLMAHEGFKNTMYKDQDGNVTVGIGHLLANADMAAELPFTKTEPTKKTGGFASFNKFTEVLAAKDDIKSLFNDYKTNPNATPPELHLSNDAVIGQCVKDVLTTETGLRSLYSGYDNFSNSRKVALVDMGFNLGIPKLKSKFPKFNDAVNRGDWNEAANESHRSLNQRGDRRNKDTYSQLLSSR